MLKSSLNLMSCALIIAFLNKILHAVSFRKIELGYE